MIALRKDVLPAVLVTAALLCGADVAHADLRIHGEGGGNAPLDEQLRGLLPGFNLGGSIDYEVVDLLAVGLFYSFNDFGVAGAADTFDHAVGARLDLRFVRHRTAGWFGNADGDAYGEAFIELDLAYHHLGGKDEAEANRVGWAIGLGYRVIVAGPFGLGPYFRFRHVVARQPENPESERIDQFYVTFGLTVFLSFDLTGDSAEDDQGEEEEAPEDDWGSFEAAGSRSNEG